MSDSFSVVFLASWYPTYEDPTLGIFIRNHAKALSNYCDVVVLHVYSSDFVKENILEHTESEHLHEYIIIFRKSKIPFLKNFIHLGKYLYYYYKLSKLAKKHFDNIRFIQINVIYPVALFFYVVKKILKVKHYTVFEQWTGYLKEDNQYKGIIRKWLTKRIVKKASKIWCLCEYQKKSMIERGLYGNYDILGNTVNANIFQEKNSAIKNPIKKFIHVSTLDNVQKNIFGILKVFSELEKEGYQFELIIIGGYGKHLEDAKEQARILNLSQVTFTGIVEQNALPHYYQSADALVMFSNYETFCVVIYEALSCGTYVVTSKVADLEKLITPDVGKVVEVGNEQELKQAIIEVLENKVICNSQKAHELIENNFSEKVIGKRFYDYYCELNKSIL